MHEQGIALGKFYICCTCVCSLPLPDLFQVLNPIKRIDKEISV
jgi:hypothetical protein